MAWNRIAEIARCKGRPGGAHLKRCKTVLIVGAWFWLEGKHPYCPDCALDATQFADVNLEPRRRVLKTLRGS